MKTIGVIINISCLYASQVDAKGINGIVLAAKNMAVGFRAIPLFPEYGYLDGHPLFNCVKDIGPFTRDQRFGWMVKA